MWSLGGGGRGYGGVLPGLVTPTLFCGTEASLSPSQSACCLCDQTSAAHLFTHISHSAAERARRNRKVQTFLALVHQFPLCHPPSPDPDPDPDPPRPSGLLLPHRFPPQRRRSESSRVLTARGPAARSRTARPAWAALEEEVSHVAAHHHHHHHCAAPGANF